MIAFLSINSKTPCGLIQFCFDINLYLENYIYIRVYNYEILRITNNNIIHIYLKNEECTDYR